MLATIFYELTTGLFTTFNSFNYVFTHKRILALAAIIPCVNLFFISALYDAILHYHETAWLVFLLMRLIRFIILTLLAFVSFVIVTYIFKSMGYLPSEFSVYQRARAKAGTIILWTGLSSLLTPLIAGVFGGTLGALSLNFNTHTLTTGIHNFWWVINLLFITIVADSALGFIDAFKTMISFIKQKWALLIGAGISFYCIKEIEEFLLYYIVLSTPNLLLKAHLISQEQLFPSAPGHTEIVLTFLAVSTLLTGIISTVLIATQITVAANCYLEYMGKSLISLTNLIWTRYIIGSTITIAIYTVAFVILDSLLLLMSIHVPSIGNVLIHFLSKGNV